MQIIHILTLPLMKVKNKLLCATKNGENLKL